MFGNRLTRTRFDIFKKMNSEQHLEDIFLTYLKVISVYFRSRNFRKFREFWPFSRKFKTRKTLFWPIRESLCSQNFYRFSHFLNLFFFLTSFFHQNAGSLVEFYNHMTTDKGCDIIKNEWKAAGITDAIRLWLNNLSSVDPFDEMDPMLQPSTASADQNQLVAISRITLQEI